MGLNPRSSDFVSVDQVKFHHFSIYSVVSHFYTNVAKDPILSKAFEDIKDWPHHIDLMTHFWWIRLGGKPYLDYSYNPIPKHFAKGFNGELLARWLSLFEESLNQYLDEEQVKLWLSIAQSIGAFLLKRNTELLNSYLRT